MDVKRGQAVVIDGLFFLMLCGVAAATLVWAGSVYGDKSFEAYRYIYMTDYVGGSLAVLSQMDYAFEEADGSAVKTSWMNEVGEYMLGTFDETYPSPHRYNAMDAQWRLLCEQAPAPLLLSVYTESKGVAKGSQDKPLYFSCGKRDDDPDSKDLTELLIDCDVPVEFSDINTEEEFEDWIDDCEPPEKLFTNIMKYPYYSSPTQSKSCSNLRCVLDIKIYY